MSALPPVVGASAEPESVRHPGEQRRRQVMGDVFVDRALALADDFSRPLQAHVNEHAWGSTWLREVLLHVAPYAGAPAAIEAFRAAKEWMADNGLQFDEQVG